MRNLSPPVLSGKTLPCFPCGIDKRPMTPRGFKDATTDVKLIEALLRRYPGSLVGVRTGEHSDLAVIDVDPRHGGEAWLGAQKLPESRIHATRSGGLHFLFRHRQGLRCSVGRIAPGVDVRAEGGYFIWWPAAGFAVLCDAPPADWPFPNLVVPPSGAFQPSAEPRFQGEHAPFRAKPQPTRDLRKRTAAILIIVEMAPRSTRNDRLFWAACRFGEIVAEGLLNTPLAEQVLTGAAHLNGLVRDDGLAQVRATIASGLRTGLEQPHPNHGESCKW
jgi:hypothetical protein